MLPLKVNSTTIPVYIGIADVFNEDERDRAVTAVARLQTLLPCTELVLVSNAAHPHASAPGWFQIVRELTTAEGLIKPNLEIEFGILCADSEVGCLHALLQKAVAPITAFRYTVTLLQGFVTGTTEHAESDDAAASDARIVSEQLAALDRFNQQLTAMPPDEGFFLSRCNVVIDPTAAHPDPAAPVAEAAGLDRLRAIGAAADHFATVCQARWQKLLLATTSQLAGLYPRNGAGRLFGLCAMAAPVSLIFSGLISALGYAMFTELSGGCQEPDFLIGSACQSPLWKHWVGPGAFFGFYLTSLAWGWCRYAAAKADRVENRHQDYRLLAECLRVQYVLGMLGQRECVHAYLPLAEHAESGWVRLAILSLEYQRSRHPDAPIGSVPDLQAPHHIARLQRARQDFIRVQAAYHADKLIVRRERALAVLNGFSALGMRLFLVILMVLVVHLVTEVVSGRHLLSEMTHHLLIIMQIVALAFWGSMHKVADLFGLEQEIQRGKLVLHALRAAEIEGPGSDLRLLHALKVFTVDQAAWHAMQRAKPIEAATGA